MLPIKPPGPGCYDEMLLANNQFRDHYHAYLAWLHQTDEKSIERKREEADLLFHRVGITFNVYGANDGEERLIPFDVVPRIIAAAEITGASRSAIASSASAVAIKSLRISSMALRWSLGSFGNNSR